MTPRAVALAILGLVVLVGVAIQFVPVERTNPPVMSEIDVSPEVADVLRRGCYDCHSNETIWPWYSKLAPMSWIAARDVQAGRAALNFSA